MSRACASSPPGCRGSQPVFRHGGPAASSVSEFVLYMTRIAFFED